MLKDNFHLNTKIVGLLGYPIKQTFSPFIHNLAFQLLELDYIYFPFSVTKSNLKNAIKSMSTFGIKGFNITIPHKETILNLVNDLSEEASIIGAVNTVVNDLGTIKGYNTDVNGIYETLFPFHDEIQNNVVTIVGAGGSARAAIFTLIRNFKPSEINIINRTEQRAENLKDYFKLKMNYDNFNTFELIQPDLISVFRNSKLIINATSVGMYPELDDTIINVNNAFTKSQIVFDMVYNPPKTQLLKIAESEGATTLNGIKMLVHQAAKAFELWTGEKMPIDQIIDALTLYITN